MELAYYALTFLSGTFFGSFLNLVSDRVVEGRPIFLGRSVCDFCKKPLKAKNLIPLLSFLVQRGKCSFCKKKLSAWYPLSEILTGFAFVFAAYYSQLFIELNFYTVLNFLYLLIVLFFYIILFLTDAKYHLLPDKIVYPAIFTVLFFLIFMPALFIKLYYDQLSQNPLGRYFIEAGVINNQIVMVLKDLIFTIGSSFVLAAFFVFLVFITKGRGMGGGDIKLAFLIGLFNGFYFYDGSVYPLNVLAILLGFVFGAVISLGLVLIRKKGFKDVIAFGPFLLLGSLVAFVWGQVIIDWYFGLF